MTPVTRVAEAPSGPVLLLDLCSFATLALWHPERGILAQSIERAPLRNEDALEKVIALLAEAQLELKAIQAIIVGSGPGSFTGIRVGLALALGLATPQAIPVYPCSSLGALLFATPKITGGPRIALIPGNSGLWYSLSEADGQERILEGEALTQALQCHTEVIVTGKVPAEFSFEPCQVAHFSDCVHIEAWAKWGLSHAPSVGGLRPNYVMASAAEKSKHELPPILLRRMEMQDLGWVAALERLTNPIPWSQNAFSKYGLNKTENPSEAIRVHAIGFVILIGDRGIGYLCASGGEDEGEIYTVATDPGWRRQGGATQLLRAFLDWAKSVGWQSVHLEVRTSNQAAQALYRRFDFTQVGLRRKYYVDNGEDALLMRWNQPRPT